MVYFLNSSLNDGNMSFTVGDDGSPYATYKVGADTVTKKLGSCDITGACARQLGSVTITRPAERFYMTNAIFTSTVYVNGVAVSPTQTLRPDASYGGFCFTFNYYDHPLNTGDVVSLALKPTNATTQCGGFAIVY